MIHVYTFSLRFGYVVMFGWCWPLAAVCALANNMFEVRSDLFKLITSYQRLPYHDAADIGAWMHVLQFMSMAGGNVSCHIMSYDCMSFVSSHIMS